MQEVKKEALSQWRKHHWYKLMEKSRRTLERVLRDKTATNRDKIEASKALARMVSGLQPERVTQKAKSSQKMPILTGVLTDEEQAELDAYIEGEE